MASDIGNYRPVTALVALIAKVVFAVFLIVKIKLAHIASSR
jgi:hypothetical protein